MKRSRSGMSIIETVVGVGIFSTVMLLVMGAMLESFKIWNRTASQTATEEVLFQIHNLVFKDLTNTSPETVNAANSIASLSAEPDGAVVWCLSFIDPATGEPVYGNGTGQGELGEPMWQRNIMYYVVVPNNHDTFAGQSCTGGDGGEGYEDQCPHKVLVRKVIDGPNDPETGKELLLADPLPYLDRPNGLDTSPMGGPGVSPEDIRLIGTNILTFRAAVADDEVTIDLRASSLEEARKQILLGTVPLSGQPTTIQRVFAVFPKNETGEG